MRISRISTEFQIARSTYYSSHSKQLVNDLNSFKVINKYYEKTKGKEGIRQLVMTIEQKEGLVFNKKRVARIKRIYDLPTQIRKKSTYKKFAKKKQEHETFPNLLERNFKNLEVDQVYCTDITELKYNGKKAYLAAVKDLGSKGIVSFEVSSSIDISLTNSAIDEALRKARPQNQESIMVHSDQGFHFTHHSFRKRVFEGGGFQSMSRKGNCLDNASMESFFGLIKDHLDLNQCSNIKDVKKEVQKKMNYYNYERPQADLKKMPPMIYRKHMLSRGFY